MSRCLLVGGAPLAAPVASLSDLCSSLWHGRFARITPGALALCRGVLLSVAGGRS